MWAEAHFHTLADQVHHLLGCGAVHLLLGCPEPQLRHPLLELFPTGSYHYIGYFDSADIDSLLHNEHARALCDMAIQTGQVQSSNQFQLHTSDVVIQSIAAAPLERPAGLLGLFLITKSQTEAFSHGEHLLLSGYLQRVAQSLEHNLLNRCTTLLHPHLISNPGNESLLASEVPRGCRPLAGTLGCPPDPLSSTELDIIGIRNDSPTWLTESVDGVIITDATATQEQKDEFISIVSHELRMPLTSIKGYAELLQAYGIADNHIEAMTPARQRRYLATIMEQADHLEVLIRDLLDMSRMQAGRLALRFTQVDVAQLCQRVAELAQQRVDHEHYAIRCLLDPQLPLAWADPNRVQQVLTNLVENAIKYSPHGGMIELLAYACHTVPPAHSHSKGPFMLHIIIRDRGIGISQHQQSLLFKPFSRLEHPATDQVPGAGLGLYITRKLVEAMHGNVTLRSSEGEGTYVTFTLPVATHIQNL